MALSEAFQAEINVLVRQFGAQKVSAELNKLATTSDLISGRLKRAMSGTTGPIFEDMAAAAKKMTVRFEMGWLSVMFFAMQTRRVLSGVFKGIVSDFQKVAGSLHPINVQFGILGATFTYLKYSIVEALSGLIESVLPTLVNWMIELSEWLQDNPEKVEKMAIAFAALFGIASIAFFVSQFALLVNGVRALLVSWPALAVVFAGFGKFFGWTVLAWGLYQAFKSLVGVLEKAFPIFKGFSEFLFGKEGEAWYMRIPLIRMLVKFGEAIQWAIDKIKTFLSAHAEFMAKLMTGAELIAKLNVPGANIYWALTGGLDINAMYDKWLSRFEGLKSKMAENVEMTVKVKYETVGMIPAGLGVNQYQPYSLTGNPYQPYSLNAVIPSTKGESVTG